MWDWQVEQNEKASGVGVNGVTLAKCAACVQVQSLLVPLSTCDPNQLCITATWTPWTKKV